MGAQGGLLQCETPPAVSILDIALIDLVDVEMTTSHEEMRTTKRRRGPFRVRGRCSSPFHDCRSLHVLDEAEGDFSGKCPPYEDESRFSAKLPLIVAVGANCVHKTKKEHMEHS